MATVERKDLLPTASHLLLWVVGFTTLIPFLWMVLTSLKSEGEVFQSHIWPQEVRLGAEGDTLRTHAGHPILSEDGQAIIITLGSPVMVGSPGDPIRDLQGRLIYDPEGQPIPIKNVESANGVAGYKNRWNPVQVDGTALTLTPELQEKWQQRLIEQRQSWRRGGQLPPAQVELTDGQVLRRANGEPYTYRDISWDRSGDPVLDVKSKQPILDNDGKTIPFAGPFPVLKGDSDPLLQGTDPLRGLFPGEDEARIVYGSDVQRQSHTRFMFSNYLRVLSDPDFKFSLYGWNSLFVAVCVMVGQVLTSAMAGFAFARIEWKGRDSVFLLYLATLMVPGIVTLLPNYVILQFLGWLDSYQALIVPAMFTAFGTFMMRQFMMGLPKGLEEAGEIDGASIWKVFWSIVMPLSKPALITLSIFSFMGTWQSFTWPLIVTHSEHMRVLPVALRYFDSSQGTNYSLLMTGSVVMMLPMIVLFIFGQRFFVRGIQLGGIKG
ncbi:MAG: ABC transporter permease subunit [Candidatus Latescibacteria bacterium]|nr:ABC transporter permease subunit [Candidatus Latescibacterota bacterium]